MVSNFNQSEATKHCFLASDWLNFETLPRKYRTLIYSSKKLRIKTKKMDEEVVIPALNKAEVDELYELFDKFDDDGNGELELEELSKMMTNLG